VSNETAVRIVNVEERTRTDGALALPQTPSEWLLARYDRVQRRAFGPQGDGRRIRHDRGSNFDRRIFDVLDDHPGAVCAVTEHGECVSWSGAASWPLASLGDDLSGEALLEAFEEIA
jgi:hypothetical protein